MIKNTLGALAKEYEIDIRTLKNMIAPIWHKLKHDQERRKILTPCEVEIVYDFLGDIQFCH